MYKTLYIDTFSGNVATTATALDYYPPIEMYLRDVSQVGISFTYNAAPITSSVLANGSKLNVGIKTASITSSVLAYANTYTLSGDGKTALVNLNLDTPALVTYFKNNVPPSQQKETFWFEVEVSASDNSFRKTYCQSEVVIHKDVNSTGASV